MTYAGFSAIHNQMGHWQVHRSSVLFPCSSSTISVFWGNRTWPLCI